MARDTSFYLYKNVNISQATGDTFYFGSRNEQQAFFNSKLFRTIQACSYQREERNYFTVSLPISLCYDIDYCAFRNASYENKLFYCFVTGVEYVSDNATMIFYEVDYLQTWLLDCNLQPCFIERQHAATDNIGDNLLPENLETGDYIIRSKQDNISSSILVIFQATFDMYGWIESGFTYKSGTSTTYIKNGLYSGLSEVCVYATVGGNNADSDSALGVILDKIFAGQNLVTIDDIVTMYVYPEIGIYTNGSGVVVAGATSEESLFTRAWEFSNRGGPVSGYGQAVGLPTIPTDANTNKVIGSYIPKNNKLFTFPYCFLQVTNNAGSVVNWKYERFANIDTPQARVLGTSTAEAKLRLIPSDYLGGGNTEIPFENGIDSAPYPTVAQIGDAYNIWLAQNRNTVLNGYSERKSKNLMEFFNSATNFMSGGGPNVVKEVYNYSMETMLNVSRINAELSDRDLAPGTATGMQSQGLSFQNGKQNFSFYVKTVDETYAKIIDDYWTCYGYPVRQVQTPQTHVRNGFTYIKTVGCVVHGQAPDKAKKTIQNIFNTGVRFWANRNSIGDYSINNDPII